jgi:hypothetical protein
MLPLPVIEYEITSPEMSPFQLDDILEVEAQLVTGKHAYTQLIHPSAEFFLVKSLYYLVHKSSNV